MARFQYRLKGANSFVVQLANSTGRDLYMAQQIDNAVTDKWQQASLSFSLADARNSAAVAAMPSANELRFLLPKGAELLIDDLLVFEP
jgi:hypothetical protein